VRSRIIDAHLHLYRTPEEGRMAKAAYPIWEYGEYQEVQFSLHAGDKQSAVWAMDQAGVARSVVANLLDAVRPGVIPGDDLKALNRWVCEISALDPRFLPLIAIDPRYLSVAENVEHLEDMVRHHAARGIKLHPPLQRLDLTERSLWPILDTCIDLDIAVVCHTGPSRDGSAVGEPDQLRSALDEFPQLRIAMAHMGGAAWRQLPAFSRDYPTVFFDLSEIIAWTGAPNAPSQSQLADLIRAVGSERVMMGSDFPWYDIKDTIDRVLALPGLSATEKDQILGENAIRFFRLSD